MSVDMNKKYDVVAIGNAILDVIGEGTDQFLEEQGMRKGDMALIDLDRAHSLHAAMGQTVRTSGGSAANTVAAMAQMGSTAKFIGRVHDDEFGEMYRHDMRAAGVDFDTAPTTDGPATGRSYIIATEDDRTMNTYLGAGANISTNEIETDAITDCKVVYGEGYQWDEGQNRDALRLAFKTARENGGKVAFTLSAMFVVGMHREEFHRMLDANEIDILFANDDEAQELFPGKTLDEAIDALQGKAEIAIVTLGEKGAVILTKDERIEVPTTAIAKEAVGDFIGAGDAWAAGFLHAYCAGKPFREAAELGHKCAAHIIGEVGARARDAFGSIAQAA